MKSDKLIAMHNGALGDFLCAWPALLALALGAGASGMMAGAPGMMAEDTGPELAAAQDGEGNDAPRLLFAGNMERMHWLAPLGYAPCPPAMRRALEGLYGLSDPYEESDADAPEKTPGSSEQHWPEALAHTMVAWFCLDRPPVAAHPRIVPLPCLTPHAETEGPAHVTDALRRRLETAHARSLPGLPRWDADWPAVWQRLFGGWKGADSRTVVLVPGAGHRAKQWPSQRFAAVAGALAQAGYNPLYVLGPAELERGLDREALVPDGLPEGHEVPVITPADHGELAQAVRSARLVIGNDSGPLHLAALHGTPVLALFGPASAAVWRPHGAAALASPLGCAPCSATLRTLGCNWKPGVGKGGGWTAQTDGDDLPGGPAPSVLSAPCMAAITVDAVLDATWKLLDAAGVAYARNAKRKTGPTPL